MPDPRKVYFGGLPLHYPERDVERLAEAAGKVRSVAVRNDEPGRRAYAFVEYEEDADAETAVKTLNDKTVDGQRISVEHYRGGRRERDGGDGGRRRGSAGGPSKTLFIGNLHENMTERALRDELDKFGGVTDVRIGQRRARDGRQHAFVEFRELSNSEDAYNSLRAGEIRGLPPRVDYDAGFTGGSGGGPDRGGRRGGDRYAPYPRARRSRSPDRYRRRSPDRRDRDRRDRSPDRRRRDDSRDRRRRSDSRDRRRERSPDSRDRRDRSPPRRDRSPPRRDRSPDSGRD